MNNDTGKFSKPLPSNETQLGALFFTATMASLIALSLLTQGCASGKGEKSLADGSVSANLNGGGGVAGVVPTPGGNASAIYGDYQAAFTSYSVGQANPAVTHRLNLKHISGKIYVSVTTASGVVVLQPRVIAPYLMGNYGIYTAFRLVTPVMQSSESGGTYGNSASSLEMVIALKNGTTFDPAQSSIRIMDCGLFGDAPCASSRLDSKYTSGLGKL